MKEPGNKARERVHLNMCPHLQLETDESVLVEHAKKALANYQHQVGGILHG